MESKQPEEIKKALGQINSKMRLESVMNFMVN
jgi:hypothetical protein